MGVFSLYALIVAFKVEGNKNQPKNTDLLNPTRHPYKRSSRQAWSSDISKSKFIIRLRGEILMLKPDKTMVSLSYRIHPV
jgi:hypothetical protein